MKEVFRHPDSAWVGLYQSILENAGIQTFVYNTGTQQAIVGGLLVAFFPLPIFFPTLVVLRDEDYDEAFTILQTIRDVGTDSLAEWNCARCGELVPATFDECWRCQA